VRAEKILGVMIAGSHQSIFSSSTSLVWHSQKLSERKYNGKKEERNKKKFP